MDRRSKKHSWLSVQALKEATDVRLACQTDSSSDEASITMEWKPNTDVNQSISFNSIHDSYTEKTDSSDALQYYLHRKDSKIKQLQRKYEKDTSRLKQEVQRFRSEAERAHQEAADLQEQALQLQQVHAAELSRLEARHEAELQKVTQDTDWMINEKTAILVAEQLEGEFSEEMSQVKAAYDRQMAELEESHHAELQERAEEYERAVVALTYDLQEVSNYYHVNLEAVEQEYAQKIARVRKEAQSRHRPRPTLIGLEDTQDLVRLRNLVASLQEEVQHKDQLLQEQQLTIDKLQREAPLEGDLQSVLTQIK